MNQADIDKFRTVLVARQAELQTMSAGSANARKPVELDQQVQGRLSRQDALQQQAMANAQEVRRAASLRKINAALVRIDEGEFGFCLECGEVIAIKRLDIDPSLERCVTCAGKT